MESIRCHSSCSQQLHLHVSKYVWFRPKRRFVEVGDAAAEGACYCPSDCVEGVVVQDYSYRQLPRTCFRSELLTCHVRRLETRLRQGRSSRVVCGKEVGSALSSWSTTPSTASSVIGDGRLSPIVSLAACCSAVAVL